MDISNERQETILENAFEWFSEHYDGEDLHHILSHHLGMTEQEIIACDFEV